MRWNRQKREKSPVVAFVIVIFHKIDAIFKKLLQFRGFSVKILFVTDKINSREVGA